MKANRKVMLGVAFVVALFALAAVGYAAGVGYKATTKVEGNNIADSNYLVISATEGTAYTPVVKTYGFDTETKYESTKFNVYFGNFYDLPESGIATGSGEYDATINTAAGTVVAYAPATTGADIYKGIKVKEVTVEVDFDKAGTTKASLEVSFSNLTTANTDVAKIFVVKTYDTTTSIITTSTDSQAITDTKNTVTYAVYLAVPTFGVEKTTFTNASLVNGAITFVATSTV